MLRVRAGGHARDPRLSRSRHIASDGKHKRRPSLKLTRNKAIPFKLSPAAGPKSRPADDESPEAILTVRSLGYMAGPDLVPLESP